VLVLQNAAGGKVQIAVDIEDKCSAAAIVRITADEVGLEVTCSMQKPQDFMDEVRRGFLMETLTTAKPCDGWCTSFAAAWPP